MEINNYTRGTAKKNEKQKKQRLILEVMKEWTWMKIRNADEENEKWRMKTKLRNGKV